MTLAILSAGSVSAQPQTTTCVPLAQAAGDLSEYGETLVWQGLMPNGRTLDLYISPRGSWTLLETVPMAGQPMSCYRADGVDWAQPVPAPGPGA